MRVFLDKNADAHPHNKTPSPSPPRATGGLGLGDGIKTHTEKWFWGKGPTPMEYILRVEPIANKGSVAACYGGVEPALGHEVRRAEAAGSPRRSS